MSYANLDSEASPLPIDRGIPLRLGDFDNLCDALDYAATAKTGFNFFDGKARLKDKLSYADLRTKAMTLAKRLVPFAEKILVLALLLSPRQNLSLCFSRANMQVLLRRPCRCL